MCAHMCTFTHTSICGHGIADLVPHSPLPLHTARKCVRRRVHCMPSFAHKHIWLHAPRTYGVYYKPICRYLRPMPGAYVYGERTMRVRSPSVNVRIYVRICCRCPVGWRAAPAVCSVQCMRVRARLHNCELPSCSAGYVAMHSRALCTALDFTREHSSSASSAEPLDKYAITQKMRVERQRRPRRQRAVYDCFYSAAPHSSKHVCHSVRLRKMQRR